MVGEFRPTLQRNRGAKRRRFLNRAYGSRDGEPITTETRHGVASITKALSGALLMMFVDRGVISLDDPIEKILPEFRREGVKTPATFQHLITHTADMDGHMTDVLNDLEHSHGEAYPFLRIGKELRYNGTSIAIAMKALEQSPDWPSPSSLNSISLVHWVANGSSR